MTSGLVSAVIVPKNEKRKEYLRKYKKRNYKHLINYKRKWCAKNKGRVRHYNRKAYWKNPERARKVSRLKYAKTREKELDRIRLAKYGIGGDEFRKRLRKQKGKCPICACILSKNPSVDHNHLTGEIRGLICNQCNLAIGNAEDSPERLRAMARYLEEANNA